MIPGICVAIKHESLQRVVQMHAKTLAWELLQPDFRSGGSRLDKLLRRIKPDDEWPRMSRLKLIMPAEDGVVLLDLDRGRAVGVAPRCGAIVHTIKDPITKAELDLLRQLMPRKHLSHYRWVGDIGDDVRRCLRPTEQSLTDLISAPGYEFGVHVHPAEFELDVCVQKLGWATWIALQSVAQSLGFVLPFAEVKW